MMAHKTTIRPRHSIALAAWLGLLAGCGGDNTYKAPPPPEVTVSRPARRSVTSYIDYTGTTQAMETVDLRARVRGFLKERRFDPGSVVKAGDLVFVIDEEPFQVRLDQARAKLEASKATLKLAEESKARQVAKAQLTLDLAILALARVEEARSRNLVNRSAAPKETFDQSEADRKKADAQVEADRAKVEQADADYQSNILSAQAAVDLSRAEARAAEIDLGYCRIVAPIDGRISRNLVDVGNLVGDTSATVLATVVKEDPIYAYMTISESDLLRFRSQVREGKRVDYKLGDVPLDLGLAGEAGFPHAGKLDYADPAVDPGTGTLLTRGIFRNPDRAIVPGLFVRVRCMLDKNPEALMVDERALGADQGGPFVLVVGKDDTVEKRSVTLGASEGGYREIASAVGQDDRVIVNGLQRARPGQKVKPKDAPPPEPPKAAVETTIDATPKTP